MMIKWRGEFFFSLHCICISRVLYRLKFILIIPTENRESVGKSLREVEKRFPDGVPLLDPVEDMKIREPEFEDTVRKIETLEHR